MSRARWCRRELRRLGRDDLGADAGNAIVEFVFLAVLVLVPLVYFVVAVADVQRSSLAVTEAAREAGRAFATGQSTQDGLARAQVAARLALADQGLDEQPEVDYVAAGSDCHAAAIAPQLRPGAVFTVCVQRAVVLPGVPTILAGRGVTTIGQYVIHVDDYRTASR